jgi:hypothetical protein
LKLGWTRPPVADKADFSQGRGSRIHFQYLRVRWLQEPCMQRRLSRRELLALGVVGTLGIGTPGCGTILYPERIGQPRVGPLDWKVVALDTIGLLLFIIPGVIAFAVDFYNGTIYLPTGYYGQAPGRERTLTKLTVPPAELDQSRIEDVVSRHASQPVRLIPGQYRTQALASVDRFWPEHDALLGG